MIRKYFYLLLTISGIIFAETASSAPYPFETNMPCPSSDAHQTGPQWSPDGSYYAFNYENSRQSTVKICDVHKGREVAITGSPESSSSALLNDRTAGKQINIVSFSWAPDSRHYAFVRSEKNDASKNGIYLGSIDQKISPDDDPFIYDNSVSSVNWVGWGEGSVIIYTTGDDIRLVSLDKVYAVKKSGLVYSSDNRKGIPVLSHDGRFMIWSEDTLNGPKLFRCDMDASGKCRNRTRLIPDKTKYKELCPSVSPDSKYVAFYSNKETTFEQEQARIYTLWTAPTEGGNAKKVSEHPVRGSSSQALCPSWAGTKIVYIAAGTEDIWPVYEAAITSRNGQLYSESRPLMKTVSKRGSQENTKGRSAVADLSVSPMTNRLAFSHQDFKNADGRFQLAWIDFGQAVSSEKKAAEDQVAQRMEAETLEVQKKEDAIQEARLKEAARLEAKRIEAERLDAQQKDAQIREAERLEAQMKEAARLESQRMEAEKLEARLKEAARQEAERKESERLEAERQEAQRREAGRLEAQMKEAARLESQRMEAEKLEARLKEAARLEAERKEAERLDAQQKEAQRREAGRLEAQMKEAARLESQRMEAEKLEARLKEAARQEAERKEAQRWEAERLEAQKREVAKMEASSKEAQKSAVRHIQPGHGLDRAEIKYAALIGKTSDTSKFTDDEKREFEQGKAAKNILLNSTQGVTETDALLNKIAEFHYYSQKIKDGIEITVIRTDPPDFYPEEFSNAAKIEDLYEALKKSGATSTRPANSSVKSTIEWFNSLLGINFYEKAAEPGRKEFSKAVISLIEKTAGLRKKNFSDLNGQEQLLIKRLNRLLFEEMYVKETPKLGERGFINIVKDDRDESVYYIRLYDRKKSDLGQDRIVDVSAGPGITGKLLDIMLDRGNTERSGNYAYFLAKKEWEYYFNLKQSWFNSASSFEISMAGVVVVSGLKNGVEIKALPVSESFSRKENSPFLKEEVRGYPMDNPYEWRLRIIK